MEWLPLEMTDKMPLANFLADSSEKALQSAPPLFSSHPSVALNAYICCLSTHYAYTHIHTYIKSSGLLGQ